MKRIATFEDVERLYVMAPSFVFAETEQINQQQRRELKTFRLLCQLVREGYEPFLPKSVWDYYLEDTKLSYYPIDYNEIVEGVKTKFIDRDSSEPHVTSMEYTNGEYGEGVYFQMAEEFANKNLKKKEIHSVEDIEKQYQELAQTIQRAIEQMTSDKWFNDLMDRLTPEDKDKLLRNLLKKNVDRLVEALSPEEKISMIRELLK